MRAYLAGILAATFVTAPASAEDFGGCRFNAAREQFAGDSAAQLSCLLKRVRPRGAGADVQAIPPWLSANVWRTPQVSAEALRTYLQSRGLLAAVTATGSLAADRPRVRYFVIHDTSSPEVPGRTLPADIDTADYNRRLLCCAFANLRGKVNLIIGRDGSSRPTVDWGATRTSAATKIEQRSRARSAMPVFVHVENIQPRAKPPGSWAWIAPQPGLTAAQEERLALAYIVASVRAGRWLMPAYHFNIDQGLPDGHDDPQNMDLASWTQRISNLVRQIG